MCSKADHVALIAAKEGGGRRLLILSPDTGHVERDATAIITRFGLDDVQTLRMSATGDRLVVGSRESFVVMDLRSGTIIYEGAARFPRISPRGDVLAFVDKRQAWWLANLAGGPPRRLMRGWAVPGVGAWSPDGRFLLVGARTSFSLFDQLVVVGCANDGFAEIGRLGEGNQGPLFNWIKRTLLTL